MTASSANVDLTPLEQDLLERYHQRYSSVGFPALHTLTVSSRESSPAGRFVHLSHEGRVSLDDGQVGLGTYSQFNVDGLEAGASFRIQIEDGKIRYLEIVVNGLFAWDGSERNWQVCDPDTGEF